jgi:Zn-dependent protease with chaperone function
VLEALNEEELSACVAHEIGHWRALDNLKRLAMRAAPDLLFATDARALERWAAASEQVARSIVAPETAATRDALSPRRWSRSRA